VGGAVKKGAKLLPLEVLAQPKVPGSGSSLPWTLSAVLLLPLALSGSWSIASAKLNDPGKRRASWPSRASQFHNLLLDPLDSTLGMCRFEVSRPRLPVARNSQERASTKTAIRLSAFILAP
jgi:hypothetical protein